MYTVVLEFIDPVTSELEADHSDVTFELVTDSNSNHNFEYAVSAETLVDLYKYLLAYNGGDNEESLFNLTSVSFQIM